MAMCMNKLPSMRVILLLIVAKKPQDIVNALQKDHGFKLKRSGQILFHLGQEFHCKMPMASSVSHLESTLMSEIAHGQPRGIYQSRPDDT